MTTVVQHLIGVIGRHLSLDARPGTHYTVAMVDSFAGMDRAYFDMTTADGKVYRIRVADITPDRGA